MTSAVEDGAKDAGPAQLVPDHERQTEWADDYAGWGNHVLYQMCREAPSHRSIDVVSSKLWLIGRSYAASLERGAGEDFHLERAAWHIIASDFDSDLRETASIMRPDLENLPKIIQVHSRLVDLVTECLPAGCKRKKRRSLASKYLHFHQPRAFFLYDSISFKNVKSRLRTLGKRPPYPAGLMGIGDPAYAEFAIDILRFRDKILEPALGGKQASPRRIDMELQNYASRSAAYINAFTRERSPFPPALCNDEEMPSIPGIVVSRPEAAIL